jgi:hypothetical protein
MDVALSWENERRDAIVEPSQRQSIEAVLCRISDPGLCFELYRSSGKTC